MTEVLLIDADEVKSVSNVSDNIDNKYILSAIREAQEIRYHGIIGSAMLAKLKSLVSAGTIGLPENAMYKALLDKSQYYLAYSCIVLLMMRVNAKIANMGVVRTSDERVEPVSLDDLVAIRSEYQSMADSYCHQLQRWILENVAFLPEITQSCVAGIRANLHSAASCGIWLGGARGRRS